MVKCPFGSLRKVARALVRNCSTSTSPGGERPLMAGSPPHGVLDGLLKGGSLSLVDGGRLLSLFVGGHDQAAIGQFPKGRFSSREIPAR